MPCDVYMTLLRCKYPVLGTKVDATAFEGGVLRCSYFAVNNALKDRPFLAVTDFD